MIPTKKNSNDAFDEKYKKDDDAITHCRFSDLDEYKRERERIMRQPQSEKIANRIMNSIENA